MEFSHIVSFIMVASLLVMSPGPNGVLLTKTVPTSGKPAGFVNIAGFVAAFYMHGSLSVFGLSILLVQSAHIFFIVKMIGATYLCWLGFKAIWDAWRGATRKVVSHGGPSTYTLKAAFYGGFSHQRSQSESFHVLSRSLPSIYSVRWKCLLCFFTRFHTCTHKCCVVFYHGFFARAFCSCF